MINRIDPLLPVGAMKTYSAIAPRATHFRPATCEEVGCPHHANGWRTTVDLTTELGIMQAAYIREQSGRRFAEHWEDGLTVFLFEAGQRCFAAHQVPLERDPLLVVRMGDWRGYGPARVHQRPEDWVEDMQASLDNVRDRQERG